jgi:STE24 endopeptidase
VRSSAFFATHAHPPHPSSLTPAIVMATTVPTFAINTVKALPQCASIDASSIQSLAQAQALFTEYETNCSIAIASHSVPFFLVLTLGFGLAVYFFEAWLDIRQRRTTFITEIPERLMSIVKSIKQDDSSSASSQKKTTTDDKKDDKKKDKLPLDKQLVKTFTSAQTYSRDKLNFSLISATYSTFENFASQWLGFMPYFWFLSVELGSKYFEWKVENDELKITALFFVLFTLFSEVTQLPFSVYSTFCIEKKHGFNTQTAGLFISDKIKSLSLTLVFGVPILSLLLSIIHWGGQNFFFYVWAFAFLFSATMMTVVPIFIMPLFNKYEPLDDGPLKTKIYALAESLKYPLTKLFIVDGSKRSNHSNAYLYGFLNSKRIVLYDTLLTQVTDDEILSILGHELGHWALNHSVVNFGITQLYMGALFYIFSLCRENVALHNAFGFDQASCPTFISLMIFITCVWAPVDKALSFALTVNSRLCEFAADKYSIEVCKMTHLQSGLTKIHLENFGSMVPDWLYSVYHFSHPPLVERLTEMKNIQENEDNKMKKTM